MKLNKSLAQIALITSLGIFPTNAQEQNLERPGLYEIKVNKVDNICLVNQIMRNIEEYTERNTDIGVELVIGTDKIHFNVWARKPGAGYSTMNKDIENLDYCARQLV